MTNLFAISPEARPDAEEYCETLASSPFLRIERIVSHGHVTPDGQWYDQDRDEWVTVLEGSAIIAYPDGAKIRLEKGDQLFLPKHLRHRVAHTSSPCIWLALFADDMILP